MLLINCHTVLFLPFSFFHFFFHFEMCFLARLSVLECAQLLKCDQKRFISVTFDGMSVILCHRVFSRLPSRLKCHQELGLKRLI